MSISGISSSLSDLTTQNVQSMMQQMKQDFTKLGTDLTSGNLSAAQQDFVTLQQDSGQSATSSTSSTTSTSQDPIAQAFNQLSTDLKSGNLTAAQQDFSTIQQDLQSSAAQSTATQGTATHHHHHHSSTASDSASSQISQLFTQLGQELQSGNVSTAQQTYATLQQDFTAAQTSSQSGTQASTANLSVSA
jgi:outer membrane protein assembly factor BamD (BamD/ComL family)